MLRAYHADHQLVPFPKRRREIAVGLRLVEHKHIIYVLTEVDVTTPRQVIQEARGEEPLSFTAFIAAWTPGGQIFLFDSERAGGFGCKDLWLISVKDVLGHSLDLP